MKIKRVIRPRSSHSRPPSTTAHSLFVKGLRQHNGGAKVTALSFSFSGRTREARGLSRIHQRHDSWTFIASCENGGLCYIHAFNFLPSPVMPNYCLLLGCAATLSFTVALAAQPAPATKPAIPAHSIEAAPKAVSPKRAKGSCGKDSSSAQGTGDHV